MAFLNHRSVFTIKSETELFSTKLTQNSVLSGQFVEIRPVNVLSDSDTPVEFYIGNEGEQYIDLPHTQLKLTVKICLEDGSDLPDDSTVAPVNCFLHSLFENISVEMQGKSISSSASLYPYRALMSSILTYSSEAKKTHLQSGLYFEDEPGKFNEITSSGFKERKKFMNKKGVVDLMGYLHVDIFNQEKFLISGVPLRLKLTRSKPQFCLMTASTDQNAYKIIISDAVLFVRKVRVNEAIALAHEKTLLRFNCRYPLNRVEMKSVTLQKETQQKCLDNLWIGSSST